MEDRKREKKQKTSMSGSKQARLVQRENQLEGRMTKKKERNIGRTAYMYNHVKKKCGKGTEKCAKKKSMPGIRKASQVSW